MPLDKHLVVHLQEMYATEHDYRDFLRDMKGHIQDAQLRNMITRQIDGIGEQLTVLQQCLSAIGQSPNMQMKSPIVQALRQEEQTTKREMPNMTPADMDVHLAMTDVSFGQMEIGSYQGMVNMAKTLNQRNVVDLLQQNLEHEQQDVQQMQRLLPNLINASQQQQRAA